LRHSGTTDSSNTGPSSAYSGSYYVYAETSDPNSPGVEFSMYRNVGDNVASISFWYHMYGSAMGTALLQGSDDGGSTYTTLWSKSGNHGDAWKSADVGIGSGGITAQTLKFSYTSGSSYDGDFALDLVEVITVKWPTLLPTYLVCPSVYFGSGSGYSGVNSELIGEYTYVGLNAADEPYWQQSSSGYFLYKYTSSGGGLNWMIRLVLGEYIAIYTTFCDFLAAPSVS
jgi:hypothetical protein